MTGHLTQAIILFAHGARDPAWGVPLHALAELVKARRPDAQVVVAFLEMQTPPLADQVSVVIAAGATHITIAPVFWARAGHVAKDLAPAVDTLRAQHSPVRFTVLPVLSELPGLLDFVADALASAPAV